MFVPSQNNSGFTQFNPLDKTGVGKAAAAPGILKKNATAPSSASESVIQATSLLEQRMHAQLSVRIQAVGTDSTVNAGAGQTAQQSEQATPATTSPDQATAASGPSGEADFSPEAVSDRILGVVKARLAEEKENGASEERIEALFSQAVEGIQKGFAEAREIIGEKGLFNDEVKDNYFETVSLVEKGLADIKQTLLGKGAGEGQVVSENADQGTDTRAARGNLSVASQSVDYSQQRTFDMQVKTRDGDTVTLTVNAGEQLNYKSGAFKTDNAQGDAFSAKYQNFSNVSFSVQGELDEGELSALNELFGEVNDIAEVFYSGNVGEAFDQALDLGFDSSELSGFAVNMTKTEVVAVKQAYANVQQGGSEKPGGGTSNSSLFDTLADFAKQVRKSQKALLETEPNSPIDRQPLFAEILAQLKPEKQDASGKVASTDGNSPNNANSPDNAVSPDSGAAPKAASAAVQENGGAGDKPFARFIQGLLG